MTLNVRIQSINQSITVALIAELVQG